MDSDELLIEIGNMFNKKTEEVKGFVEELKTHFDDVKTHMGVLVEDLRGDIKAVAEGHSVLDKKIDDLRDDLIDTKKDLNKSIQILSHDVSGLKHDVVGFKKRYENS